MTATIAPTVDPRANIARKRAAEFQPGSEESTNVHAALAAGNALWHAVWRPLYVENPAALGGVEPVEGSRCLVRSDSGAPLGIHGGSYTELQQTRCFAGVQDVIDSGDCRIIRCNTYQGGKKVAIECELNAATGDIKVGSPVRTKLVFSNSHDGTSNAAASVVLEVLACLNGMTRVERLAGMKFRHTAGIHAKLEQWQLAFAAQRETTAQTVARFRALTSRKLNDRALTAYVREVLSEGAGADDTIAVKGVDRIVQLAHEAPGADPGTMWGGLQAVTYWATHERGRSEDGRAVANLFGTGGALIQRASEVAFELAERLPSNEMGRAASNAHATASLEFGSLLGRRSTVLDQADAE